jgi:hypothetical protein
MVTEILNIVRSLPLEPPRMEPHPSSYVDLDNLPTGATFSYVVPQEELDKLKAKLWVKPWPVPRMTSVEAAATVTKPTSPKQRKKK